MHPHLDRFVTWTGKHRSKLVAWFVILAHVAGAITSVRAVMDSRTAQGAVAWVISLNTLPYIAVPAYWVFGSSDFNGYVTARRSSDESLRRFWEDFQETLEKGDLIYESDRSNPFVAEQLAELPATRGNDAELLINGDATYRSMLEGSTQAEDYVLVQFYIIRGDSVGRELRDALVERARDGVRCYVLYDEIGSRLPKAYLRSLTEAGIRVLPFNTTQGASNRFQLNFRNHRKIVVVDGREAWVGGLNVGEEYKGLDPKFGFWRDTHMRVEGPVVQCVQVSFAEDWHWAAKERL